MRWIIFIFIFITITTSQTVFASAAKLGSKAQSQRAHQMAAPKGKALIYIYYGRTDGKGISPKVWLNSASVGRLVPGTFTVWQIKPGALTVKVDGMKSSSISLTSRAGQKYHFRLLIKTSKAGKRTKLKLISSKTSQYFSYTRWLSNPKQVTSVARAKSKPPRKESQQTKKDADDDDLDSSLDSGPSNIGIIVKTGALKLSEENQSITVNATQHDLQFDSSASGVLHIEAYGKFSGGFTAGGEIASYSAQFSAVSLSGTHDVDVLLIFANVRQFFRDQSRLQPFIGAGLGFVSADVSGPDISGSPNGFAYQVMAGAEYRFSNLGVFGEYKFINAEAEDSNNQNIDVSGSGIYAGLTFHF